MATFFYLPRLASYLLDLAFIPVDFIVQAIFQQL